MIDIEMPERCGLCPCFHAEFPMYCKLIKPPDKDKRIIAPYGLPRPEWCPLEEQEPKTILDIADPIDGIEVGKCPRCERTILNKQSDPTRFCKYCGQEVIFE